MHPVPAQGHPRVAGAALLLSWGPGGVAMWLQRKHAARSRVPAYRFCCLFPVLRAPAGRAWRRIVAKPGIFLDVPVFPGRLPGGG